MSTNIWTDSELQKFTTHLKQVIVWTEKLARNFDFEHGKYGLVFRQTNPVLKSPQLYSLQETRTYRLYTFEGDCAAWTVDNYSFDRYDSLLGLALEQRQSPQNIDLSKLDELGRILSFQTCITTHDGAPIAESRGFVDEGDVPPIDTWFYLKRDYLHAGCRCDQSLFCWIPRKFEAVMQQAIDVEILGSYQWFDENDKATYERIKNRA